MASAINAEIYGGAKSCQVDIAWRIQNLPVSFVQSSEKKETTEKSARKYHLRLKNYPAARAHSKVTEHSYSGE